MQIRDCLLTGFFSCARYLEQVYPRCQRFDCEQVDERFEVFGQVKTQRGCNAIRVLRPQPRKPFRYDRHPYTLCNIFFRVPHNASSVLTGRQDLTERLERSILPGKTQTQLPTQKRFILYGLCGSGKTQFCLTFIQDHRQK